MNDRLLAAVSLYGAPALFGIVAIAAIGLPLPITLLLILAGSMVSQNAMNLWWAIAAAWRRVHSRRSGRLRHRPVGRGSGRRQGLAGRLGARAERAGRSKPERKAWGGPGIFITRCLLTPLGPWINLASGAAGYPWHRFLFWDALGEFTGAQPSTSLWDDTSAIACWPYTAVLGDHELGRWWR
jgi:membrane-associated protein